MNFLPSSFRDRGARVLERDGQIYRSLNAAALQEWRQVRRSEFLSAALGAGRVVGTVECAPEMAASFGLPALSGLLHHDRIPFISYPYEWPFELLKKAALLHLRLMADGLRDDVILKDASPYNIQFRGVKPVLIDVGSFTLLRPGEPWAAYRQFCEMFLFPLMLQAYRGVAFQPILRGSLEGLPVAEFSRWLSMRDLMRKGVFSHVTLHSALSRSAKSRQTSTLAGLSESGFDRGLIEANVSRLTRVVEQLRWNPRESTWADYDQTSLQVAQDSEAKARCVREVAETKRWRLAWDMGCNRGRYSKILSEFAETVLALDGDPLCVELLARDLEREGRTNILPLVMNMANPSPAQGWRGRERLTLEDRGRPDLILCLGLIHHLVISSNIPLADVIEQLAALGGTLVIEFPTKQDPMVQGLLRNKSDQYADYELPVFEAELQKSFEVLRRERLPSGERHLFVAAPRPRG
jgi:SAM-dependent methyltransferase